MLDTTLTARPESIEAARDYLSQGVAHLREWERDSLASIAAAQDLWAGQAGSGYIGHAQDGVKAAIDLADEFAKAVEHLTPLLTTLLECLEAMDEARTAARIAGLYVSGNVIYAPQWPVWQVYGPGGVTMPEYDKALVQVVAWGMARDREYRARRTWANAVAKYRDDALTDGIAGLLDIGGVGLETSMGVVSLRVAYYTEGVDAVEGMISSLKANLGALKVDGRLMGSKNLYYDFLDERGTLLKKSADLADSLDAAKKLGSKLGKASVVLGVVGFGYGTYADMADGESVTQALVSNGVDWGVATAFTVGGAALGSFVVPPIGTVVGGVIGGVVGVFAGSFANGFVDHWFEDVSPDLGGAISSGWDELKNTGEQVGDLFSGVWNSIF